MATTERAPAPRVLLGVTGGIAAYKAPELVRRLVERGCEVQVVMSRGAREFVGPLTFQAVSGRRVRDDLWDPAAEAAMGHIELARWADVVVVAPATAHFLGHAGRRLGRRSAVDGVPRDDGADRARAGHEPGDVGQRGRAGEPRVARGARRALSRPRDGRSGVRRDRAGPHARAQRDRRGAARADGPAARAAARRVSRSSSRRARRASRSTPCATSRTAARERWASPSPLRRAKPVPRSCS